MAQKPKGIWLKYQCRPETVSLKPNNPNACQGNYNSSSGPLFARGERNTEKRV
jgi:hypothetical protein